MTEQTNQDTVVLRHRVLDSTFLISIKEGLVFSSFAKDGSQILPFLLRIRRKKRSCDSEDWTT